MRLALKTRKELAIVREFKMHDFDSVDAIIFRVTCDIDSRETATPKLINEFITSLDDTAYHVTTHQLCSFSKATPRGYYTSLSHECHCHILFLLALLLNET